jgi:hypothetical protein
MYIPAKIAVAPRAKNMDITWEEGGGGGGGGAIDFSPPKFSTLFLLEGIFFFLFLKALESDYHYFF